jgi:hypothetical protein
MNTYMICQANERGDCVKDRYKFMKGTCKGILKKLVSRHIKKYVLTDYHKEFFENYKGAETHPILKIIKDDFLIKYDYEDLHWTFFGRPLEIREIINAEVVEFISNYSLTEFNESQKKYLDPMFILENPDVGLVEWIENNIN